MKIITLKTLTMLCMLFSYNLHASTNWIPISVGDITIIIPYVPDSIIYEDAQGNLYVKLTASHGSKLLKLTKSLYWTSSEIQQDEWDELSLTVSEYSISYGNFLGDSAQDLKVLNDNVEIIIENNNSGYVVSQPADSPDDGTIGNIDADGNGIRDDVALEIPQLFPTDSYKRGYLQHVAYYFREFLLTDDDADKTRNYSEVLKGYACLVDSAGGEEAYASIVSAHLDSKERFERYTRNNKVFTQQSVEVNSLDCVLQGTGVEPVSGCYQQNYSWSSIVPQHNGWISHPNLIMGENVKLIISAKNKATDSNWKFDFSYFLNEVEKEKTNLVGGGKVSWTIDNYNFDTDGYLKLLGNNATNSIWFEWSVTCEAN
jgi:hypothetical protein